MPKLRHQAPSLSLQARRRAANGRWFSSTTTGTSGTSRTVTYSTVTDVTSQNSSRTSPKAAPLPAATPMPAATPNASSMATAPPALSSRPAPSTRHRCGRDSPHTWRTVTFRPRTAWRSTAVLVVEPTT